MRRHPVLQKLSGDHHGGLVQVRHLREATPATVESRARQFLARWRLELQPHFREEELALLPAVCPPLDPRHPAVAEMLAQHIEIRAEAERLRAALPDGDRERLLGITSVLAERLAAHIELEEQQVFEAIQAALSDEELAQLGRRLAAWEAAAADVGLGY